VDMNNELIFKQVTLLVTHYNRSISLERLLESFKELGISFQSIVVSDDGSKPEHVSYIRAIQGKYQFELITTPVNKGLGNNINKGQDAVSTPLTLYVQEDFIPQPLFKESLEHAVSFMEERSDLDMVRFYAYFKYPYLVPYKNGFSEMQFRVSFPGYKKFYFYSDHPHLRRRNFFSRFGRYPEGIKGDATEYRMMMSVLHNKGKALFYDDFKALFIQQNSEDEPSTMHRNFWRETNNPLVSFMRHLYRYLKFNLNYISFRN